MASTYSSRLSLELLENSSKAGLWGGITNTNMQILDKATHGVGVIDLTSAGATYTLLTQNLTLSEGQNTVLVFENATEAVTVTISPNDQQKVFIVKNSCSYGVTLTQGSGGNVIVPAGYLALVYADGAGSGAAVVDLTLALMTQNLRAFGNIFTLPTSDGTTGQVLATNGSGTFAFADAGASTGKAIAMAIVFG